MGLALTSTSIQDCFRCFVPHASAAMLRFCAHAGMSATYPLDMVRGRLTVQSMQGNHRYRGIMHATSVIIKEVSSMLLTPASGKTAGRMPTA